MKKRLLTWAEFDQAVDVIAEAVRGRVGSVFGVPRGGLPLAVALSHRLGVPLDYELDSRTLVVDDVVETGLTMRRFEKHDPSLFWAWVNKSEFEANAVIRDQHIGWIVFPWEASSAAERDADEYYARR